MPKYIHKTKTESRRPVSREYSYRRLEFLWRFLAANNINFTVCAHKIGVSAATISRWFNLDDIMLSRAQQIAEGFDYELVPSIHPKGECKDISAILNMQQLICNNDAGNLTLKRLSFLRINIDRAPMMKKDIAKSIGIEYTSLNRWFTTDDIAISRLIQLAELLDWAIHFDFKYKGTMVSDVPGVHYSFEIKRCTDFETYTRKKD